MSVTLSNGANENSFNSLVNMSIQELFGNEVLCELLAFNSSQSVNVIRGGHTYTNVDTYEWIIEDGDQIFFNRVEGTKGIG